MTPTTYHITEAWLREREACDEGIAAFVAHYPNGLHYDPTDARLAAELLAGPLAEHVKWAVDNGLPPMRIAAGYRGSATVDRERRGRGHCDRRVRGHRDRRVRGHCDRRGRGLRERRALRHRDRRGRGLRDRRVRGHRDRRVRGHRDRRGRGLRERRVRGHRERR